MLLSTEGPVWYLFLRTELILVLALVFLPILSFHLTPTVSLSFWLYELSCVASNSFLLNATRVNKKMMLQTVHCNN